MWRIASTSLAKSAAVSLLTSDYAWSIVFFDLAIEDIRAREYRGSTGTLASMKVNSEAPASGASPNPEVQVRVLALLRGLPFLRQPHAGRRVPD